jgi:hypothetical protein
MCQHSSPHLLLRVGPWGQTGVQPQPLACYCMRHVNASLGLSRTLHGKYCLRQHDVFAQRPKCWGMNTSPSMHDTLVSPTCSV